MTRIPAPKSPTPFLVYSVGLAIFLVSAMAGGPAGAVTLDQFLSNLKSTHPKMKSEKLAPQVENSEREMLAGDSDWLLKITPKAQHTESSLVQPGLPEASTTYGSEVSLEKSVWATGTRVKFTASSEYVDLTYGQQFSPAPNGQNGGAPQTQQQQPNRPPQTPQPPTGSQNLLLKSGPQYRTGVGMQISQPILRNFGGAQDRMKYEAAGSDVKKSEADAAGSQRSFLLEMSKRFVDWALAAEKARIARERLTQEERELEPLIRRRQAGGPAGLDSLRAQDALLSARSGAALASAAQKAIGAELSAQAQSDKIAGETPELDLFKLAPVPSPEEAVRNAEKKSKTLAALFARKERLSGLREALADKASPQLTLNLGGGVKGEDKEYGKSLALDRQEWNASLAFVYPIGNTSASGDVRKNELEQVKIDEEIRAARLALAAEVKMLSTQIAETDKALAIGRERMEAAEERASEETRLYSTGKGDLAMALLARDNAEKARLAHAETAAARWGVKLRLDSAMDNL